MLFAPTCIGCIIPFIRTCLSQFSDRVINQAVFILQEGTTKVVFAYHTEDPETENDFKQHTFRGSRSILLLNNMDKKQIDETEWKSFVVQNKNVRTYTT